MLVVSPLVALMKNQVDLLQKRGVRAVYAGEAKPCSHFRDEIHEGQYQVVYFKMLFTVNDWRDMLANSTYQQNLIALVIDEAHCVKTW